MRTTGGRPCITYLYINNDAPRVGIAEGDDSALDEVGSGVAEEAAMEAGHAGTADEAELAEALAHRAVIIEPSDGAGIAHAQ